MRSCARCGAPAVVYQQHTGLSLCGRCFLEDVAGRVRAELERWGLVGPGDRVLLAVSGGKDSFTLLDVMAGLLGPGRVAALTIDEGGPGGWRLREAEPLMRHARSLGVDYIVVSFREEYGAGLEEMVERARRRGLSVKPCTICGVLRRRLMDEAARRHGFTKLATAHNLDDEAQTAVMNIVRGDWIGLVRQHPLAALQGIGDFVPRIKPLRRIHEYETALYSKLHGYGPPPYECPYLAMQPTLRLRVRLAMYSITWLDDPGAPGRLIEVLDELLEPHARGLSEMPRLPKCEMCGRPTSYGRRLCKACEILLALGLA